MTTKTDELTFVGIPAYSVAVDEEYLSEGQKKHLEKVLLLWKKQLMQQVDETVSHLQGEASNSADVLDRAAQEEEFNIELRTRDRERKLIRKIEKTLELLKEEDYGYCESCGAEIGLKRLEVRPTATLCVDCKTVDEIKEHRTTT
jgi:DnaK suppressor protein